MHRTVDECKVRVQIWDTAGQGKKNKKRSSKKMCILIEIIERFRAMAPMYYRGAHAALLVYDITSQESFEELSSWIEGKLFDCCEGKMVT